MVAKVLIFWIALQTPPHARCKATRFGDPGDPLGSERLMFTGKTARRSGSGIAHRKWPGNAPVLVCHKNRCAFGRVLDRGPYGAVSRSTGKWYNYAPRFRDQITVTDLEYRGCADLTPEMADAVELHGRGRVRIWRLDLLDSRI